MTEAPQWLTEAKVRFELAEREKEAARLARTVNTGYWCPYCGQREMSQDPASFDYNLGLATVCGACHETTNGLEAWQKSGD